MDKCTCLEWLSPLEKPSFSLGMSVNDLWFGMVSHKSQVSELNNWIPKHSKKAKCWGRAQSWWRSSQVWEAKVECHWHEANGQKKKKKEMHRRPVSPTGVLLLVFLSKKSHLRNSHLRSSHLGSSTKFLTCSKSAK